MRVSADKEHEEHLTHVLHQLQNKPWAALCCVYSLCLFLGCLAFMLFNKLLKQVGHLVFRVMQGITAYFQ
jgi:hypothetical protein